MEQKELLSLLLQAKNKEQKAQSKLINHYWATVYAFVFQNVKDPVLADEITVASFSKVLNKLNLYNPSFEFKTWVLTIAQNTTIDYWRRQQKEHRNMHVDLQTLENTSVQSPEELLIAQENSENILDTLNKMDAKYQTIIRLRFFEEKSLKEISEELKLSLPNTKVRIMRAKKILAELLRSQVK